VNSEWWAVWCQGCECLFLYVFAFQIFVPGDVIRRFLVEGPGRDPIERVVEWAFGRLGQASTMTACRVEGTSSVP